MMWHSCTQSGGVGGFGDRRSGFPGSPHASSYYDLRVNGESHSNAVWCYREPLPAAKKIKGYVAFWNGVEVRE